MRLTLFILSTFVLLEGTFRFLIWIAVVALSIWFILLRTKFEYLSVKLTHQFPLNCHPQGSNTALLSCFAELQHAPQTEQAFREPAFHGHSGMSTSQWQRNLSLLPLAQESENLCGKTAASFSKCHLQCSRLCSRKQKYWEVLTRKSNLFWS